MNSTTTPLAVRTPSAVPTPAGRRGGVLAALLAAPLAATLALSACGSATQTDAGAVGAATSATSAPRTTDHGSEHALTLDSAWVKAGSGMTAAFGTINNPTDHAVTIVEGSTSAAGMVQLHTMQKQADGSTTMTEQKAGFVVPPRGSLTLSPGGDHIMLMGLRSALSNGQDVTLSMVSSDGEVFAWTVPVRSFAGADETYAPGSPTDLPTMHDMSPTSAASH